MKSIEEIAREDGWSEADSYFDYLLSFGELVRRSDREHWLEVATLAACVYCRESVPFSHEPDLPNWHNIGTADKLDYRMCNAFRIRSAFATQEKNHG